MYLYQNKNAQLEARVQDLLSRMTLEEKFSQLRMNEKVNALVADEAVQEADFASRAAQSFDPERTSCCYLRFYTRPKLVNEIQKYNLEHSRLGIPMLFMGESVHGSMMNGATVFPQAIGLGSTFDPELIGQVAAVCGRDSRAAGVRLAYAPDLDISQDPRWGRVEENYGEDPYLTSRYAVEYVKNIQAEGVSACPKHYLAHGTPEAGVNIGPVHIGEREIREQMLPPFAAAVQEGGTWCVMPAYSELEGVPLHANRHWLTTVLREELGFDGFVTADFGAVHMLDRTQRVAQSGVEAGEMAMRAGMDVEAPNIFGFGAELEEKFRKGELPMALVDTAVSRVLRVKFRLGLFEDPYVDEKEAALRRGDAAKQLAYRAAVESAVLLKNENGVLPLSAGKKIALVGPNAKVAQLGDYTAPGNMENAVSLYEGLTAKVPGLVYEQGCSLVTRRESFDRAVEAVRQADVAILAMGDTSHYFGGIGWGSEDGIATCGEGFDSHDLLLPPCQKELIRACAATGTPLVLVLYTGRPYALTEELGLCDAMVQAWYPGEQGGHAIADLLLGNENFSGKLSISFPMSVGQLPCYYNHKVTARGIYRRPGSYENPGRDYVFAAPKALFRFGYGLSYSSYSYSDLEVKHLDGYRYRVSVKVENTSDRAGTEVVQLYLTDDRCRMSPYVERLRGFARVTLQPGEAKTVEFSLDEKDLSFINEQMQPEVEPGSFTVRVAQLKDTFTVT